MLTTLGKSKLAKRKHPNENVGVLEFDVVLILINTGRITVRKLLPLFHPFAYVERSALCQLGQVIEQA